MQGAKDNKSQENTPMSLQEAIAQLSKTSKTYPDEAVSVVLNNADEARPYLYEAIDHAISKGKALAEDEMLYFYSLFILGELSDTEAFERIVAMASLPADVVDFLLGGAVTEGLSDILYNTYNGNMELLKASIKNEDIDMFVRSAMLDVLGQLYLDGKWSREMLQDFLKELIYSPQELDDYIYTSVQGIILDCHFKEMLPDIRYMLDEDLVDTTVHGKYDDSVDYVFRYYFPRTLCEKPMRTDCLRHWAMFERESSGTDHLDEDVLEDLYKNVKKDFTNTGNFKKTKIGRNDPCPCGSGKKYKFCCMKKMNGAVEEIETEVQRSHWLVNYPKTGGEKVEGRLYLDDFYDEESIAIDRLLYLALHYRAIPIWERETPDVVEKRKRWYLSRALDKFTEKMAKEGFSSLKEYDEKCSIHYMCREWMGAYQELLAGEAGSDHARILKEWCQ